MFVTLQCNFTGDDVKRKIEIETANFDLTLDDSKFFKAIITAIRIPLKSKKWLIERKGKAQLKIQHIRRLFDEI